VIALRVAEVDDRDEVERLLASYLFEFDGRTGPYPDLDWYWAHADQLPFLIEADAQPVGVCLIRIRDGGWSIAELFVQPSHRRAGIGRAAIEALVEEARAASADHLEAKVHPDNQAALPFWKKLRFETISSGTPTGVVIAKRPL
jgi:predicted acetyltransferase